MAKTAAERQKKWWQKWLTQQHEFISQLEKRLKELNQKDGGYES